MATTKKKTETTAQKKKKAEEEWSKSVKSEGAVIESNKFKMEMYNFSGVKNVFPTKENSTTFKIYPPELKWVNTTAKRTGDQVISAKLDAYLDDDLAGTFEYSKTSDTSVYSGTISADSEFLTLQIAQWFSKTKPQRILSFKMTYDVTFKYKTTVKKKTTTKTVNLVQEDPIDIVTNAENVYYRISSISDLLEITYARCNASGVEDDNGMGVKYSFRGYLDNDHDWTSDNKATVVVACTPFKKTFSNITETNFYREGYFYDSSKLFTEETSPTVSVTLMDTKGTVDELSGDVDFEDDFSGAGQWMIHQNLEREKDSDVEKTYQCHVRKVLEHMKNYSGSAVTSFKWKLRTLGVSYIWSDWSMERKVEISAPPELSLRTNLEYDGGDSLIMTNYPLEIDMFAGPESQKPLSYSLRITSNQDYSIDGIDGERIFVARDEIVYDSVVDVPIKVLADSDDPSLFIITPSDVTFMSGVSYKISANVTMNTGLSLTSDQTLNFTPDFSEVGKPDIDLDIDFDTDTYSADLMLSAGWTSSSELEAVYKSLYEYIYLNASATDRVKLKNDPDLGETYKSLSELTDDELRVELENSDEYAQWQTALDRESSGIDKVSDYSFAIYRRENNGEFTEIASDITDASDGVYASVTDPYPQLKVARYRVVATNIKTGAIFYEDFDDDDIQCSDIVIQWNTSWINHMSYNEEVEDVNLGANMLKLPYNVDTAEAYKPDKSLVEYIGRKRPVKYSGTQLGEGASWNTDVPKSDTETINQLRKLAVWQDSVYVRERNGTGYWADVEVSFSFTHNSPVVPVSLSVTRIEGPSPAEMNRESSD